MAKAVSKAVKQTGAKGKAPKGPASRWVYGFNELDAARKGLASWDEVKGLLGGKGANLAEMMRLGLPVPPGFTVTTAACRAFLKTNAFPQGMWEQELKALTALEKATGKKFGDASNPLLVSCRSGAKFSMPGMMDTVLNIGLNDATAEGLAALTKDARFAWDAYRRLVQMFSCVVMDLPDEPFEEVLHEWREKRKVANDADLQPEDLKAITARFKEIVKKLSGKAFPEDPFEQLRLATLAVFSSWKGKRAQDYRKAAGIADDLGTAVNIQTMVFGNMGAGSATGVATTRNVSTGENELEGDYLMNAQGEDVVAGIRVTNPIAELEKDMPKSFKELSRLARLLEKHYRDVQDIEFTVERGKLFMLQTRDAKRTARAAVKIAVDLTKEKLITREEAIVRVRPEHIDFYLHPQFDPKSVKAAKAEGRVVAKGLNVSPGAAVGMLAFDANKAVDWAEKEKKAVIMIRPETKPDDVHGMLAAKGILTSRGGRTSHAALVARQFGKPAVVGVMELNVDVESRTATVSGSPAVMKEGDWVSIDGSTGEVFLGKLDTVQPSIEDPALIEILKWADAARSLGVWANADYPRDAERAREMGAEGIGLCRTEHMFFETDRLPLVQKLILAKEAAERAEVLAKLLPMQRGDFDGLFRAMNGLPVTIRLIDPPLHEFLPAHDELLKEVTVLETRIELGGTGKKDDAELAKKKAMLDAVEKLREQNPMLGLRGVRLGIHMPELVKMQVRAIFEAACDCKKDGIKVFPKIMIPLIAHINELKVEQSMLVDEAKTVMKEKGITIKYEFGTMIEIPRAALTADQIAEEAQFFSFGTNDLTQTTFGISRDDAETGFLVQYMAKGILAENPFASLDETGIGRLMRIAVESGRKTRPGLDIGICGEHGGDPKSIDLCHRLGLNYVSCSPFRVPIARLAAAHAAIAAAKVAASGKAKGAKAKK